MIRFATPADHPRLKALWAEVFGDSREAVDSYFALRHADAHMLVFEEQHIVAGMLTMLPLTLRTADGSLLKARYVYAVATDARYRGQSISTALLEAAHRYMLQEGTAASILVPASPGLFDFYAKRGYQTAFSLDIVTLHASKLPPVPPHSTVTACSAQTYTRLRNAAFVNSRLFAKWDEKAVSYAMHTFAQGGGTAAVSWDGGEGCAAWEKTVDGVLVKELALVRGDALTALSVLHGQLQASHYAARLAQQTLPGTPPAPFGMIHWLAAEPALAGSPPYLSLVLD